MRYLWALLAFFLTVVAGAQTPPPNPTEWVTDTTGSFLSVPARQELNAKLQAYERTSGHQILVWIGTTTGTTAPMEDWTVAAFQAWRVGRKGIDDGLVLFLFATDHTARIEVGYGLEGKVPDAAASRVLSETILPRLKTGDREGAVRAGIDQLLRTIGGDVNAGGELQAPVARPLSLLEKVLLGFAALAVLVLAVRYPRLAFFLFYFFLSGGRGGGGGGSGGRQGGGGRSGGGGASGSW